MSLKSQNCQKVHLESILNQHCKFLLPSSVLRGIMRKFFCRLMENSKSYNKSFVRTGCSNSSRGLKLGRLLTGSFGGLNWPLEWNWNGM